MAEVLRLRDFNRMKGLPYDPAEDGFVYSSSEIETEAQRRDRREAAEIAQSVHFNCTEFQRKAA